MRTIRTLVYPLLVLAVSSCHGQPADPTAPDTTTDPKPFQKPQPIEMPGLNYIGAFRLPTQTFGESSVNFAQGPIAYDSKRNSLFIVGHAHHQAIAEFPVPDIRNVEQIDQLATAGAPLQIFTRILNRVSGGNEQGTNTIGSLRIISVAGEQKLLVGAFIYYPGYSGATHTHMLIESPYSIANSPITGFFQMQGGPGRTSGWTSPVPPELQEGLGGTYLAGMSSGWPIISRLSVGPTAFAFNHEDFASDDLTIPTKTLLNYDLKEEMRLHPDLSNKEGYNTLWTHLSYGVYGFIIPETHTYLVLGNSGGHTHGVCYKCLQNTGTECAGFCSPDTADYYNFCWIYDVKDLMKVRRKEVASHTIRPLSYGQIKFPLLDERYYRLGGGCFDPQSRRLFLSVRAGDNVSRLKGGYDRPPLIVVYQL